MDIYTFKETAGLIGAFLTTFAFFPQTIKIFKTKKAGDVSIIMLIILIIGISCWLAYGIYLKSVQLVLANGLSLIINTSTLIFKIRYSRV